MRAHSLQKIFLFLLVHTCNSEFLENLIYQELLHQTTFRCGQVLNGLTLYDVIYNLKYMHELLSIFAIIHHVSCHIHKCRLYVSV